jgi:iron(III) transport system ATP-binding protein
MTPIRIDYITKRFGATLAVDHVTLEIGAGELFFLLGPSGCGKTTLLRVLAGFVEPDAGEIYFGEKRITHLRPRFRDAGMVFQTYALWPHLSVNANVAYGLRVRGRSRREVAQRVENALKMTHLEGLGERRPHQLSGGQQQRVALARALVVEPRVLLLDEPLSNLDARLRDEMREEIRRLHRETGLTMVYVTHDQKEALTLADRLAVMDRGRLVQVGRPRDVYNQPLNRAVAAFLGDSNFLPGTVELVSYDQCTVETPIGPLVSLAARGCPAKGTKVFCSIRPHALALDATGVNQIAGKIQQVTYLGELLHIQVLAAGNTVLQVRTLPQAAGRLNPGDLVALSVPPDEVVILGDGP